MTDTSMACPLCGGVAEHGPECMSVSAMPGAVRCGYCGELVSPDAVDRCSLCPKCKRGLERTNFD